MKHSLTRWLLALLPVALIFFHVLQIGFWFTGDTLSYLEHAYQGGPLTTFLLHAKEWPPGTALVFGFLRYLIPRPDLVLRVYVITILLASIASLSLVVYTLTRQWWFGAWASALMLLIPPQVWLLEAALSEPIMMIAGNLTLFALLQWQKTAQERWILLGVLTGAWIPLARYLGIPLLFALQLTWTLRWKNSSEHHLSWSGFASLLLWSWLPLCLYLFRNKILYGTPFGPRDHSSELALWPAVLGRFTMLARDLTLPASLAFLLGRITPSSLRPFISLRSTTLTALTLMIGMYLLALILGESRYQVHDLFPSRYLSPLYAWTLLLVYLVGTRRQTLISSVNWSRLVILATLALLFALSGIVHKSRANRNAVPGALAAYDLQSWCGQTAPKLLLKPLSRHWVALSTMYFCQGTTILRDATSLVAGDILLTPYQLSQFVELESTFIGPKTMYRYRVVQPHELLVQEMYDRQTGWE